MQKNITQNHLLRFFRKCGLFVLVAIVSLTANSQTITTSGGTGYTAGFAVANPAAQLQTLVIENTNATARVLTNITMIVGPNSAVTAGTASTVKLWYSATSLSGVPTVTTPIWTQIGTGSYTVPTVATELPVISGLNFSIPPATQYRFAIEATAGLRFSVTPLPTPNTFTVGGVNLKLGDVQIAAANIGYAGLSPTPAAGNTPTFFCGSVTLVPFVACSGTPAPGNTVTSASSVPPATSFTLSLQNTTPGTNLVYQWQSSSTLAGPYTPIVGANSATYTVPSMSTTTYYNCIVTCGANSATSTPVVVTSIPAYCPSNASSTADEEILNVTFGTLNNSSTCATLAPGTGSILNEYSNYTGYAGAPVATVLRGLSTPLSVQIGTCGGNFTNTVAVWIDYNQDGAFAASERVYNSAASAIGPHTETANILIPVTALPGTTRMRVISDETGTSTSIPVCNSTATYTWGETEDYNVNIVVPTPCTGTPAPGNTISTATSVCAGTTGFTLSLQNNPAVSGLTYQWFSSPTATGTFTPIAGATNSTLSIANINAATCYYAAVTCSGSTANSTPVCVGINPATQCYCASNASSTADEEILNVTVGTLNNTSTCATLAPGSGSILNEYSNYTGYTGAPAAPSVTQGTNVPFSVSVGTCGGSFTNSMAIFIDLNANGNFTDPGERVYVSPGAGVTGPHIETGNLVIPATATLGVTRMRVIVSETGTPTAIAPCNSIAQYTWGETEDYNVNITPCIPLTVTTQPANTSAVCGSSTSLTFAVTGTSPVYQWQYRTTATSPWLNVPPTAPYSGTTTGTLTVNPVATSMSGYQYRVVFSGGCTVTDFSNIATLTVTPIIAVVTPASATLCLGATQQLTITNIASPVALSQTFSSPVLAIPIPDGVPAGISNTINIPAGSIPAGATVTNITVAVNVPHTYVSDLMLVVKGPNNAILNLSNLIGGANAPGANFTNTRFSSTATAALNSGTAPGYTGIYKPDAAPAVGAFGLPSGPTGFLPTISGAGGTLAAFHAQPNGAWTIAMYDAGPPDVGTLIGWSVKIDYILGSPATGVFTGPAGTIFTNAGATTPYTGTPINSVFVKPLTGGVNNYSVVVTDAACSSAPLTIPITVNQAVAGTATLPATTTICEGSNTSFTLGGTLSGPSAFIHQYQVSTNGGGTYTNIVDGGVYSGATTNTLTLTNVPTTFNGYKFRDSISAAGACGSLISSVATLTVNPKPIVTISAAPLTHLYPGLTTTLTAAVSPNATGAAYQWFRNGTAVTGATTNMLVVGIDALGTYSIRVTDANGCVSAAGTSTPNSIVISDSANLTRLFIYPSPNTGQFQVRFFNDITNNGLVPGVVNVYDEKGSRVFTKTYTVGGGYQPLNVDLGANHAKGIYRVDLLTRSGERIKTGSVMVF